MRCRSIDPDYDKGIAFCRSCGYELKETRRGWWRHTATLRKAVWQK